jgi:hypothetical protein
MKLFKSIILIAVLAATPMTAFAGGSGGSGGNDIDIGVSAGAEAAAAAIAGANNTVNIKGSAASAQAIAALCGKAVGAQVIGFGMAASRPDMNCVMLQNLPALTAAGVFSKNEAKFIALSTWGGNVTITYPDGSRLVAKRGKVSIELAASSASVSSKDKAPAKTAVSSKSSPVDGAITVKVLASNATEMKLRVNGTVYVVKGEKLATWKSGGKLNFDGAKLRMSDLPA